MSDCPKCQTLMWCADHGSDGVVIVARSARDAAVAARREAEADADRLAAVIRSLGALTGPEQSALAAHDAAVAARPGPRP